MPKIITFRSVSRGSGASTLASTLANEIAQQKSKVLFVEANLVSPSFAISTGISHPTKNFLNLVNNGNGSYKLTNYIASPDDLDKKLANKLHGMDTLTVPRHINKNDQVRLNDPNRWSEKFMNTLKELTYDYIIIDVPTELDEFTSYPIFSRSDEVLSVVEGTPKALIEYMNEKLWLQENNLAVSETLIVNKHDKDFESDIWNILDEIEYLNIPYDPMRVREEWLLNFGSDLINVKLQNVQAHLGVQGVGFTEKASPFRGLMKFGR